MSLQEILPGIQLLSRKEKLDLIQFLAQDLAESEAHSLIEPNQTYPFWSPTEAFEAAAILLDELEKEKTKQ